MGRCQLTVLGAPDGLADVLDVGEDRLDHLGRSLDLDNDFGHPVVSGQGSDVTHPNESTPGACSGERAAWGDSYGRSWPDRPALRCMCVEGGGGSSKRGHFRSAAAALLLPPKARGWGGVALLTCSDRTGPRTRSC